MSLKAFEEYLKTEWVPALSETAAVEIKYKHSVSIKKTKEPSNLVCNNMTISLKFVDNDVKVLDRKAVKFVNDRFQGKKTAFVNISIKELENKYACAKNEIITQLVNDTVAKINELKNDIDLLKEYAGQTGEVIDRQFKGEIIKLAPAKSSKNKEDLRSRSPTSFDM